MGDKLFAVYLGGRAPKCNTELHDVVFVIGKTIEATYEQLMDKWFGTPTGLHLDSYMELDVVDGYEISISDKAPDNGKKLFFINLGAYSDGQFTEIHANKFIVAESAPEAKAKGKSALLKNWPSPAHVDDLHELDDCLEVSEVSSCRIVLKETDKKEELKPINGYHLVPKDIVQEYISRKSQMRFNGKHEYIKSFGSMIDACFGSFIKLCKCKVIPVGNKN